MTAFRVYVTPTAWKEIKQLPGNIRQRIRRAIGELPSEPRPHTSQPLELPGVEREIRRIRLDRWRIVYCVDEVERTIDVMAVRKRPPYDYGDLGQLLADEA